MTRKPRPQRPPQPPAPSRSAENGPGAPAPVDSDPSRAAGAAAAGARSSPASASAERLLELADGLGERTTQARRQLEQLDAALSRLRRRGEPLSGPAPDEPLSGPAPEEPLSGPAPDDSREARSAKGRRERGGGGPGRRDARRSREAEDAVRLVTLEMSRQGVPRADIERHLHDAFGLDDAAGVLDEVFAHPAGRERGPGADRTGP